MRITGPGRTTGPQAGSGARRAESGGATFAPTGTPEAPRAGTPAATASLAGLDALIALQAVDPDRPRGRRRAVRQGHDLLDLLDEIKVGLLSGAVSGPALDRLLLVVGSIELTGDEQLDGLLADIGLRAEVELAKLGRYR